MTSQSDKLRDEMEAAIGAYFADQVGGMMQGFVLQSYGQNLSDTEPNEDGAMRSRYLRSYMSGQSTVVTLGLRDLLDVGVDSDCIGDFEDVDDV